MDQSAIHPFVVSVRNTFETMLQMGVEIGEPVVKADRAPSHDVSGIIGFNGDVGGSVVLSFPFATAQRIVSVFTGMHVGDEATDDIADAVGELVNMIAGGAKAQFPGRTVSISCPSVIVGENHTVQCARGAVCVLIPCGCDCGGFTVEVAIRSVPADAAGDGRARRVA
ncbi:MAG: chemotaxis protein CheX [bacterium]|nr:chemotaxis protein CheX [bacterium]